MTFSSILLLALGLAMDCTAVAAAAGLATRRILPRHVLLVALFFGGFQMAMPLLGWLAGGLVGRRLVAWDHWIAFLLLAGVGAKMLWEAFETGDEAEGRGDPFRIPNLLLLAIATSIDSLAVGVTLPLLHAPLLTSLLTIGVTAGLLSAAGLFAGRRFGAILGSRLDFAGGLILVGLGVKILLEHLGAP